MKIKGIIDELKGLKGVLEGPTELIITCKENVFTSTFYETLYGKVKFEIIEKNLQTTYIYGQEIIRGTYKVKVTPESDIAIIQVKERRDYLGIEITYWLYDHGKWYYVPYHPKTMALIAQIIIEENERNARKTNP